jgi:hypothetical protein
MTGVEPGIAKKTIKQKEWSRDQPSRCITPRCAAQFGLNVIDLHFYSLRRVDLGILTLYQWLLSDLLLSDIARSKPLDHSNCVTNA